MWLLLIIVLGSEPPYKHRGSVQNFYTTESECRTDLAAALQALQLKGTKVSGSCEFRDYLTPNRTF
jgi:hypothetical protein